jgi:NitT/TauT family transport system ATP-binding protein
MSIDLGQSGCVRKEPVRVHLDGAHVELPTGIALAGVRRIFDGAKGPFLAVDGVDFTIASGEFVSIVGPSGCGKSTLLSLIAGLARPDGGSVRVLDQEVRTIQKEVGFIFQRDALLPWRTALQNVTLGLRYRGVPRKEANERAKAWLARVGLAKFHDNYPHQLSGGMRKRVAIAATLAFEPRILLMDEPFSALDVQTRTLMENDLLSLWDQSGQTVLFITHDLEEAIGLSDRVLVMGASPGRIIGEHRVELERPRDLLDIRSDPTFVATYDTLWEQLRAEVLKASDV